MITTDMIAAIGTKPRKAFSAFRAPWSSLAFCANSSFLPCIRLVDARGRPSPATAPSAFNHLGPAAGAASLAARASCGTNSVATTSSVVAFAVLHDLAQLAVAAPAVADANPHMIFSLPIFSSELGPES
eukprot:CAMPEP_0197675292 /NCGR_PEP_ID=MMETSP1338-20131121/84680_1 /TAXON_ID=43686 ORGANISM="Pelagodinium beii, Strain RCC1491" /NCGR_SAMPLE_ID=MMETSP1338 /ASSEMBLY_ACC=CAM_ASM_000754 /LENGTH=128 /DNA_ID=CAMNT_0043255825 /DNA_START=163 /DNA_END=550 /DNA_ORIENTATION=+